MFVIKFYLIFIIIKLNCCDLMEESLSLDDNSNNNNLYTNNNNNSNNSNSNNNNINNSNNSSQSLEMQLKNTAVNITQINDLDVQSNDYTPRFHLTALKSPRGFLTISPVTVTAAPRNSYTHFYADNPLLSLTKVSYANLGKFLIPQLPSIHRVEEPNNNNNILGSGDFGVMSGGTFYPPEEMPYHIKSQNDNYHESATTITEGTTNSDGLVYKYTTADKQFERFHDFADLTSPNMESDFTKYVIVYANRRINTTKHETEQNLPLNNNNYNNNNINENLNDNGNNYEHQYPEIINEQLIKIDEEKRNRIKQMPGLQNHDSKNKLNLFTKAWLMKKPNDFNLYKKSTNDIRINDKEDPLVALS